MFWLLWDSKFVCVVSPMFFGHEQLFTNCCVRQISTLKTLEGKKKTLLAKISQVGAFAKYESLESFPTFRGKNTKAVGNHHLVPFSGHTHISLHTIVFLLPKQRQAPQTWTFIARDSGIKNHHILSLLSFVGKKVHLWRGCAKSTMAISK